MGTVEATRSPQPVSESPAPVHEGPPRVARCPTCGAFTYDPNGLSEEELRRLVLDTERRVLVRLVTRKDGRVMTTDCGHGTLRERRRAPRWLVAVVLLVAGVLLRSALARREAFVVPEPSSASVVGSEPVAPAVQAPEPVAPVEVEPPLLVEPLRDPPPAVVEGVRVPPPQRVDVHLAELMSSWSTVTNGRVIATPADVAADLEQRLEPVRACYRAVLEREPTWRGTLNATLFVDEAGQVSRVSMPLIRNRAAHDGLKDCCEAALKHEVFPWGNGSVTFRLVFAGAL